MERILCGSFSNLDALATKMAEGFKTDWAGLRAARFENLRRFIGNSHNSKEHHGQKITAMKPTFKRT